MSYFKTAILLAGLTGLFMGVGYLIGGASGAMIALVVAAATNLFAYWNSDRMVLSMYGAHQVDQNSAPDLFNLVAELAGRAGLPMPRVFVMDEVGRAVAVDLMGTVHRQHHAVRIPVGEQVCRGGDHERDHGPAGAANQIADAHEECGEACEQKRGAEIVHGCLPRPSPWCMILPENRCPLFRIMH